MLSQEQIEHLISLPENELISLLNGYSLEEVENLYVSVENQIQNNETVSPQEKEAFITTLSFIETKRNGMRQEQGIQSEFIDTSQFHQLSSNELIDTLGLTIKKDNENKLLTFLGMLSAYTNESQLNISFNAPSSAGKSYIALEIAQYFPEKDVIKLGGASPTAFFHDQGVYDKEANTITVDLERKIIIFLDQPNTALLQKLRSFLSHDERIIKHKITDKNQRGGNRTKNVLLKGFPVVIFCSAGFHIDEQESTRFLLLSPDISQEKIRAAILERIKKESDSFSYKYLLESDERRALLKKRIQAIRQEPISDLIIEHPEEIENQFFNRISALKPRHSRDTGRICSLVKVFALLNVWFRKREGSALYVNQSDIDEAFKLWDVISEAQELNIPPYVYNFYKTVIVKGFEAKNDEESNGVKVGLSRQEILKLHYSTYGRHLSDYQLRKDLLPLLETTGLIYQEKDQNGDARKLLVYPTTSSTISSDKNKSGVSGGVSENDNTTST